MEHSNTKKNSLCHLLSQNPLALIASLASLNVLADLGSTSPLTDCSIGSVQTSFANLLQ